MNELNFMRKDVRVGNEDACMNLDFDDWVNNTFEVHEDLVFAEWKNTEWGNEDKDLDFE